MPARVCPFCNKSLHEFEYYFCSSCCKKLPKELVKPFEIKFSRRGSSKKEKPKIDLRAMFKVLDKKKMSSLGLVMLGVICIVLIAVNLVPRIPNLALYNPSKSGVSMQNVEEKKPAVESLNKVVDSQRDLRSGVFGKSGFADMVPFDTTLYLELFDIGWLMTNPNLFEDTLTEKLMKMNSPYCIFVYKNEADQNIWSLIVDSQSFAELDMLFAEMSSDYWKYEVVSDKIVISGAEETFDMVSQAAAGLTQSYAMNPFHAQAVSSSPSEGKVLLVMSGYDGRKLVESILNKEEWNEILPIVNKILDMGYNEVVIR